MARIGWIISVNGPAIPVGNLSGYITRHKYTDN